MSEPSELRDARAPAEAPATSPPRSPEGSPRSGRATVASQASNGSMRFCANVDVRTREELGERLLHCLASIIVFRALSADEALVELQHAVLPPGESEPEERGVFGLALLRQRVDKVARKKNLGTALARIFTKDQLDAKVEHKVHDLERSGAFASGVRDRLAATLVQHYDMARHHHCGFDMTSRSLPEVEQHAASCRFLAVRCPHRGCGVCLSAHEMVGHDEGCPFKPVPCPRGCGSEVAKHEMETHVDRDCARRPVICPFHRIGCEIGCAQAELAEHMSAHTTRHLLLALGQISSQQQQIDRFAAQVLDARSKALAAESEVACGKREMAALSKSFVAMQKEQTSLHKQLAAQEAHAKKLDHALSKLDAAHGSAEKELRASFAKLSHEHAATMRAVDNATKATTSDRP